MTPPARQIRAAYDDETITVYQAYAPAIAVPAAAANSFAGTPFSLGRMTWIKPSFLWMMYRSGWATKEGQKRVLAITITRGGFEEALTQASLSHFEPGVYADFAAWRARKDTSPVRVQWDPERDLRLAPLPWRSLQVGLSGRAAHDYVHRWTVRIDDITDRVHAIHALVRAGVSDAARAELPVERPYALPAEVAAAIGAS